MALNEQKITLMPASLSPFSPTKPRDRQIAVLMSGGVDSSTTAHLLKERGWDVLGVTMKIPAAIGIEAQGCCGSEAAFVCEQLGISHYFVDVKEAFEQLIVDNFRNSYANGRTPNPCVDCNTLLKFTLLWDLIRKEFGINYFATGHYARVYQKDRKARLARACDSTKDQSYFIYGIPRRKLPYLVLPMGEFTKEKTRRFAEKTNLRTAKRPESMELCFAGGSDYRLALSDEQQGQNGDITDMQGNRLGTHKGLENYTLGQRKGLGIAGGKPLYVARIDVKNNALALGTRQQVSFRQIAANKLNILIEQQFQPGKQCFGKIRSYGDTQKCTINECHEDAVTVEFDKAIFAPCPGQKLVLYNENAEVIAGGTINGVKA